MTTGTGSTSNNPNSGTSKPNASVNIEVGGNVAGNIIVGDNNIINTYHTVHGNVINYHTPPAIKARDLKPQPPRVPRGFVGRDLELRKLEKHINDRVPVLVFGPDGIGKTDLVKMATNSDPATSIPDGILFIEGKDDAPASLGFQDIIQQLFDALFESNPPVKATPLTARTYLSNTTPLIVLDRYDIQISSLEELTDIFPSGEIIATRRSSLFSDVFESIELTPLIRDESMELLAVKSGIENTLTNSTRLNEVCELLGDVPLAIIKTANIIREKKIGLESVSNTLRQIHPPSQDNIQAAIERSYGLIFYNLDDNERGMLAQAAAAPGISIERNWLENVAGGKQTSDSLENMELLQANSPRLRLADGYRRVIISSTRNIESLRESFLNYLLEQLKSKSLDFDFLGEELGNFLGLIQWSADRQRWSDVITLGRAADPYLTLHGLWDAWEVVLAQMLVAAQNSGKQDIQAWVLHQLGTREGCIGIQTQARKFLEDALQLRKTLKDVAGAAYTQHNLNVLFPPPIDRKKRDKEPDPGESGSQMVTSELGSLRLVNAWIVPALIAVIAFIAIVAYSFANRWRVFTSEDYGFMVRYPGINEMVIVSREPLFGKSELVISPNTFYNKEMNVVASRGMDEDQCGMPIDRENWQVERITFGDNQFLKAINEISDRNQAGYVVYATTREPGVWVCLVFSYTPIESVAEPPSSFSTDSEIAIFDQIVNTFSWLSFPPPTETFTGTPPTITRTATDTYTPTITDTPTETPTSTTTYTPTITLTPTYTSTFTPSVTNTPCIYPSNWYLYTVQSGDTLFGISQWYGVSWQELAKANCKTSNNIFVGETLYVPSRPPYGSITGYLFADLNKNEIQDSNETRLSNVRVTLKDANGIDIKTFDTNDNGEYEFPNLTYGTYFIYDFQFNIKPAQTIEHNFGLAPAPYR